MCTPHAAPQLTGRIAERLQERRQALGVQLPVRLLRVRGKAHEVGAGLKAKGVLAVGAKEW
jgi:hypothetical protein